MAILKLSEDPAHIRAQQINALARMMPALMIVNMVNAGTLALVLYTTDQFRTLDAIWTAAIGFFSLQSLLRVRYQRLRTVPDTVSRRSVIRVLRSAAVYGLIWVYPGMLVLPIIDGWAQMFAAALMTGMICGGAIALYPFPMAAVIYSGLVTIGCLIGLLVEGNPAATGLAIIAASFFFVFFQVIRRHAQLFVSEFVARRDLQESHKSVARLLVETKSEATEEKRRSQKRLAEAQKMEAIGQLTGGIAHDFNNLLAVIQGNAELLEQLDIRNDLKPITSAIVHATGRGAELTQRLLAFSRKQPLRPEAVNMHALLTSMAEVMQRMLGETIEVIARSEDCSWKALADPGQVEAALLNLGINARDAMQDGGKLTIECKNITMDENSSVNGSDIPAGEYVVLSVSDHGVGMSEEVRKHAFEPFFTTKEVGQGSGLGLSMVYGFAQQSGGQATIYSEEGQGTTINLYLPRARSEIENPEKPHMEAVPRGKGETILVVEDDPEVLRLAEVMLGNLGYRVICVESVKSAWEIIDRNVKIDLVLTDVVLASGASGPEFAEELRTFWPEMRIIFMSGYPTEAARQNGFLGSDSVLLNKPFRLVQLAREVKTALE